MALTASESSIAIDSSALIAIHLKERGFESLLQKVFRAQICIVGAPVLLETAMVLASRMGADAGLVLEASVRRMRIQVVPFTEDHFQIATAAFLRFGKSRHRAALNFGDCMSYAIAELSGFPLLYTGEDFSRAGVQRA